MAPITSSMCTQLNFWRPPRARNSWKVPAARLAAVLPNPRRFRVDAPSAYVQKRTAWIAQQMGQLGGPAYLTRPAPVAGHVR